MCRESSANEKEPVKDRMKKTGSDCSGWLDGKLFLNLLIAVAVVFSLSGLLTRWQAKKTVERQQEEVETVLNTIYSFMATATDEEYGDIAQEIHSSLILRTLHTEDLEYLDLIPNTAENCPLDQEESPQSAALYLVALNTGEMYPITPSRGELPEEDGISADFGYDEVSRSTIVITRDADEGLTEVALLRRDGEISIQRMKRYFCETCFQTLIETLTDKSVLEFVIFDAAAHEIYPIVESAEYSTGDFTVSISRAAETGGNSYELQVRYAG